MKTDNNGLHTYNNTEQIEVQTRHLVDVGRVADTTKHMVVSETQTFVVFLLQSTRCLGVRSSPRVPIVAKTQSGGFRPNTTAVIFTIKFW